MIESARENKIKPCFIVNKMFVFLAAAMVWDSSQKRFKPVYLNLVLIHKHWIRQSINVPATSCNQVTGKRNTGCDNDLVHLLLRCLILPSLCWCLQFVCCIMVRRNPRCIRTAAQWHAHGSIADKAIWRLEGFYFSPFQIGLIKKTTTTRNNVGESVKVWKEIQQRIYNMTRCIKQK